MYDITPLFGGGIPGTPEMMVILLIAVLLFGANKIPKLARSTGEAMGEFKKGRQEVEEELQEMQEGPDPGAGPEPGTAPEPGAGPEADDDFVDTEPVTSEETESETETEE